MRFTLSKSFSPATINAGEVSTITFTFNNTDFAGHGDMSFIDNLPAGLVVADTPNVVNGCGGTVTANPGATSISLSGGNQLTQNQQCTIMVDVTSDTAGIYVNGPFTFSFRVAGGPEETGTSGSATLTVLEAPTKSITIIKCTNCVPGSFKFKELTNKVDPFWIDVKRSKGEKKLENLEPGKYIFKECVSRGWTLTKVECDTPDSKYDRCNETLTVNLADQDVTCTFNNKKCCCCCYED
jgi:hypothetical protein